MPYLRKGTQPRTRPQIWDALNEHPVGLGGGMLDTTELPSINGMLTYYGVAVYALILKGCPIYLDADNKAHVVKSALVIDGGTTTAPYISKDHLYKVGDCVYCSGAAVTVSSIDDSNANYDVLTLSGPCEGAISGQILEQSVEVGANPIKKYNPNVLLGNDYKMIAGETLNLVFRIDEWLQKDRFVYPMSISTINSLAPNIIIK